MGVQYGLNILFYLILIETRYLELFGIEDYKPSICCSQIQQDADRLYL